MNSLENLGILWKSGKAKRIVTENAFFIYKSWKSYMFIYLFNVNIKNVIERIHLTHRTFIAH